MPTYQIDTLEMFETRATYTVEAETLEEAIEMIKNGQVAYDSHEHLGSADEFIEVTHWTC